MNDLQHLHLVARQHNAALGAFALGSCIPGALMAARAAQWAGSWGATGQAFSQSAIFLLPAVAAWAAWCAGADRRRSVQELVAGTRRGRAGAATRIGAQVLLATLCGAVAAFGVSLVVTAHRGAADWVAPWAALPLVGGIALVVVLGVLAGTTLSSVAVPPGLVALVYLVQSTAAYQGSALADALSIAEFRSLTHSRLALVPVLARTLLWCAVAAAVALTAIRAYGHSASSGRTIRRARDLSLVVCSLSSTIVLLSAGSDLGQDADSLAPVCRPASVTVCVTAAHRSSLGSTTAWVDAVLEPLHPVLPQNLMVVESGLEQVSPSGAARVEVGFVDAGGRLLQQPRRATLQAQVLEAVLHVGCSGPAAGTASAPSHTDHTVAVHRWLSRRVQVPTDGSVMPGATPLDVLPQDPLPSSLEQQLRGAGSAAGREQLRHGLPCLISGGPGTPG